MHEFALKPEELYTLWADSSGAGVEKVDLERRDPICVLLNSIFFSRALHQLVGGS